MVVQLNVFMDFWTQVNYILGSTGRSFVVGYGVNPPTHCHHRGASCYGPNRLQKAPPFNSHILFRFTPIFSKNTLSAVVTQIVPTQTRTCSQEPWLVGREKQMTSNKSYSFFKNSSGHKETCPLLRSFSYVRFLLSATTMRGTTM